ncbi:hypothetical protein ACWGCW_00935 [Streptomyces sp. NPDC054933]
MSDHRVKALTAVEVEHVITRADGTVERIGTAAYWHKNPLRRAWWRLVGERRTQRRIREANRSAAQHAAESKEA